ncbi:MAG: type II toxin-antitoxin system VapC family toxin [Gemmatimonadales bacterium]
MIVVDTNVIAYLFLPGDQTPHARRALQRDPTWAAPLLWRSELRSVLTTSLRRGHLTLADASEVMDVAAALLAGAEYEVESGAVLRLAAASRCSAYDCEFVALAQELRVPLVTADRQILEEFGTLATALTTYATG